jgi:Histidine kinase-, DNA gyrase B-, and HSP90-like ATPase
MARPLRARRPKDQIVGKLRAADPFELIRWLARSQPDPRKALAELVQNSIDAGARRIEISRLRERGVTALHITDDGEGVIPELSREEALTYIATHIGHSRKRNLTPQERRELMLQGKYGIGLLGFWAIGQVLEMRSQLPGQPPVLLRLFEDSPRYEIERVRSRLAFGDRSTEVVVRGLHRSAFVSLSARRIADYLAAELRGQLLARDVTVLVRDRIARSRAPKVLEVQPTRFSGQRLDLPTAVPVAGFAPLQVELYLVPSGDQTGRVSISSGGTTVYDDVCDLEIADCRHPPWTDGRLTGLLEFPDFEVAPSTRRGVMPNQAALAFAEALRELEPAVAALLREADARGAAALDADVLRQLERAFRDIPRLAPEYDFFAVRADGIGAVGASSPTEVVRDPGAGEGAVPVGAALPPPPPDGGELAEEPPSLLPAGALATLQIIPASTRVERLGERRLRADARDAAGTPIRRPLAVDWMVEGGLAHLDAQSGPMVVFHAGSEIGTAIVRAVAREGDARAAAEASVKIVEASAADEARRAGIPEPVFFDDAAGNWRSRMRGNQWEVNRAHPDFAGAAETPRRKLRYLAALLAKEVVLHSFPQPLLGPALERLVEVLTITERRLER